MFASAVLDGSMGGEGRAGEGNAVLRSADRAADAPNAKTARLAGVFWIIQGIIGGFAQVFVRDRLIVAGDIAATAGNIMSSELLFRFGFLCDLLMLLFLIATAFALYRLLSGVNRTWASWMVLLAALGSAIGMLNYLNELVSLRLLGGSEYASAFGPGQAQALAMLYLQAYEEGYMIAQVFYMLWVLPLGFLVYRSGFLPKIFGVLFVCETTFGLAGTFLHFLFPDWAIDDYLLIPGACAEISFMLWLTVRGIGKPAASAAPRASVSHSENPALPLKYSITILHEI